MFSSASFLCRASQAPRASGDRPLGGSSSPRLKAATASFAAVSLSHPEGSPGWRQCSLAGISLSQSTPYARGRNQVPRETGPKRSRASGAERRRSWTLEQKQEIVSESLGPELTPTEVARKHGISTGQIYTWRHHLLSGRSTTLLQAPRFASVELSPSSSTMSSSTPAPTLAPGSIEIVLPGGSAATAD